MKSAVLAIGIFAGLLAVGARAARADTTLLLPAAPHVIQVDDDDEGDGWVPFWFGLRAFAPRRQVIVERHYYYGPTYAPPPPSYAPPPPTYWYYCQEPEGYYPHVRSCPGGWMRVVPQPDGNP